jgi:predicted Zn-dependent protease
VTALFLAIALCSAKAGAPATDLSLGELLMLSDALENKGEPERALSTLEAFERAFHEEPEYWGRLARVREAKEDLAGAMAALERRDELVAPSVEDAVHQATLLWRLHRPQVALWRLQSVRALARERDGGYWNLLGQIAWAEEQHALAAEAMRMAWRTQRTPEVADLLVESLEATGQSLDRLAVLADASTIDSERFLMEAIDAAVVLERWEEARRLLARGEAERRLAEQSHFWIMRATLAKHERRPQDAERDLARALALDPRSSDAHETWLQVAVQSRDPAMIRRALEHWGPAADGDEAAWSMLAEAHTLLGDQARAAGFQARARAHRQATGEPLTADEEIADAVERHDRPTIEETLRRHQGRLSLAPHVLALRELGRDEEAWTLLAGAGHTADPSPELIAAGLTADTIDELREQHASAARVWGETRVTGPLELRSAGAAVELRKRAWLFGLRAQGTRLEERDWSLILARGREEAELGVAAKLRSSLGETSARLGALVDGAGTLPQAELRQRLDWRDGAARGRAGRRRRRAGGPLALAPGAVVGRLGRPLRHPRARAADLGAGGARRGGGPPALEERLPAPAGGRLSQLVPAARPGAARAGPVLQPPAEPGRGAGPGLHQRGRRADHRVAVGGGRGHPARPGPSLPPGRLGGPAVAGPQEQLRLRGRRGPGLRARPRAGPVGLPLERRQRGGRAHRGGHAEVHAAVAALSALENVLRRSRRRPSLQTAGPSKPSLSCNLPI